jgi:hypothetical protein
VEIVFYQSLVNDQVTTPWVTQHTKGHHIFIDHHGSGAKVCARHGVSSLPFYLQYAVHEITCSNLYRCGRGGIGEALVTEYKRRGVHAIATVLPREASDHLSEAGITFFPLDVTVEQSIVDLKAAVQKLTGRSLDVLVNCA